jgi:hypothetical protein
MTSLAQNIYSVPAGVPLDVIGGAQNIIENFWPDTDRIIGAFQNRIRHLNEMASCSAPDIADSKRARAQSYRLCLDEFERLLEVRANEAIQSTKELQRWAG